MKILALEKEIPGVAPAAFTPGLLKQEAARVWELQQAGLLRETWFRQDRHEAVLILECADAAEAQRTLATLPLVSAGLIAFEVIPLVPYPGLARLFESGSR
jgi:muconolactone delta-isomerase